MIIFVRLSGLLDNDLKIVYTALLPELHVRAAQTNFQLMQLAILPPRFVKFRMSICSS